MLFCFLLDSVKYVYKYCASLLYNYKFPPLHKGHWNNQIRTGLYCPLHQLLHPAVLPSFLLCHSDLNNMKQLRMYHTVGPKWTSLNAQNAMWCEITAGLKFYLHSKLSYPSIYDLFAFVANCILYIFKHQQINNCLCHMGCRLMFANTLSINVYQRKE